MLNVVVETDCAERERATGPACGLDWGVAEFATLALEDGGFEILANPRHLDAAAAGLRDEQRQLSAAARARKISGRALRKYRRALARRHAKVAARRKDFLHKVSAGLIARHRLIATEELTVRNLTRSARGTIEAPGRNVAQKAGLNRAILDTGPGTFLNMLRYKAEEAGIALLEAPVRALKPSQRCPDCGALHRKPLSERRHDCACGCSLGRDEAAALVLLKWGLDEDERRHDPRNDHTAGTVVGQAAA